VRLFDSTFVLLLVDENASAPPGARSAFEYMFEGLTDKDTIVIPTVVFAEIMYTAGVEAVQSYMALLRKQKRIVIAPFDEKAAVELGLINSEIKARGGPKRSGQTGDWAKVKYDRLLLATGKAHGVTSIYTDDGDLANLARRHGIEAFQTCDLPVRPVPPEDPQRDLFAKSEVVITEDDLSRGGRDGET
jgi:predicted nucleic acid-binding protein